MTKLRVHEKVCPEVLYSGRELVEKSCVIDGPSGNEKAVAEFFASQLYDTDAGIFTDRVGNLFAVVKGGGEGYDERNPVKIMLNAHMDEVGFLVTEITDKGYLKFVCVGGIDSRVLCARTVRFDGADGKVPGVICSPAIHGMSADQRKKATKDSEMVIDIGARSKDEAAALVPLGSYGTFDSDFVFFGKDECFMKGKAIDDRAGCTVMIETLRKLKKNGVKLPFDIVCAFTCREEIGNSGAILAANRFRPDYAVVLETTAIADRPDVNENSRVANVGNGGVISFADRSTLYNIGFIRRALALAGEKKIPAQIKRYISGGNDAGRIHQAAAGCRCLTISLPTRYLHSAACVASVDDYNSISALVYAILTCFDFSQGE